MSYTNLILSQPPKGEWFSPKTMIGHLIVIFGNTGIEEQPDNMNPGKTRQVATIDYVDLDDGQGGRIVWGAQCDKPGIVNKIKNQRNAIMGRLEYGEAKAGQSAPYILVDHTAADAERFNNAWLPANREALAGKANQAPAPAQAQAAPAPVQYQQPQVQQQQPQLNYQPQAAQVPAGQPDVSAEAMAAIQRMMAAGQLPGMPQPTH